MKTRFGKGKGILTLSMEDAKKRSDATRKKESVEELDIDKLIPGEYQPRKIFVEEELSEMEDSIRAHGIEQPLIVRPKGDVYEIISGERRWRGAKLAGLITVPCINREYDDKKTIVSSLIDNLHRVDLNPIEEAYTYKRLKQEFKMTDQEVADIRSCSRSKITNTLRLLTLSDLTQNAVLEGQIEMGHARALIPLPADQQQHLTSVIVKRGLSVRQVERMIRETDVEPTPTSPEIDGYKNDIKDVTSRIEKSTGSTVKSKVFSSGRLLISIELENLAQLRELEKRFFKSS